MNTDLMMTTKEIAAHTQLTPRMINIYRATAEKRLGVIFGRKEGRTTYFNGEEVREILKSRDADRAGNAGNAGTSPNYREASDFSDRNDAAEDSTLSGMDALVAANDKQAALVGQAMGSRFIEVMKASAISAMQVGTNQLLQQFSEMGSAIAVPLNHQPQLPGSDPNVPQLESYED